MASFLDFFCLKFRLRGSIDEMAMILCIFRLKHEMREELHKPYKRSGKSPEKSSTGTLSTAPEISR